MKNQNIIVGTTILVLIRRGLRMSMMKSHDHLARWWVNPVSMVRELFGVEPDPWQIEALMSFPKNPRIVMKASKGVGKTCVMAWLIWNFLLTRPNPKIACVSIDASNLADNLWTELAHWRNKSELLKHVFEWTKTRIFHKENKETWWCSARSFPRAADKTQQANSLAGLHSDYIMFVLDESGGMHEGIMASAQNALSSCIEGHILQAGNPTHLEGALYNACVKNAKMWKVIEINSDPENPMRSPRVSKEWANEQIEAYGRNDPWVLVNVFGQFPPSSFNALIGPDEIREAMKRYYRDYEIGRVARIMGVDVARFGDDSSVIAFRQGCQMFPFKKYRSLDSTQGAGRVAREWNDWMADACFIDASGGFGSGWIDQLKNLGKTPIGIQFAGKVHKPELFENKRAEMYFDFCDWIKKGGALPNCPELIAQLTATTYTFTKKGLLIIEPKDVVKSKLNGQSPDEADAAVLTFAEPVSVFQREEGNSKTYSYATDYNPYAERV